MSILNRSYARDIGRCWGPIHFAGERYNFLMNAPVTDPSFDNFRLDLKSLDTGTITINIGTLQRTMLDLIRYNIYCSFIFPLVPVGAYQFIIRDTVANVDKAVSNMIIVEDTDAVSNTAQLAYRHKFNKYGYPYEEMPDWYNIVRYPLIHKGFAIEKELRQYRNASNQKLRNYSAYSDHVYTIESYHFTEEGHKEIASIYDHDTIFLNAVFITPKTNYTIEDNIRTVLTNGSIQVVSDESVVPPAMILIGVVVYSDEYSSEYE
jgi:hypothetical protein